MVAQVSKTAKKQTEITSPAIFRCTCKETGQVFYGVKSDSSDETYKVTYNEQAHRYECSCPATCECKHLRAVRSVVIAKAEISKIIEKPQEDGTIEVVTETGKRVATIRREQQAPSHEGEGKLPVETVQRIMNWHQSQAGDEMEREYEENRKANVRYMYNDL